MESQGGQDGNGDKTKKIQQYGKEKPQLLKSSPGNERASKEDK